MRARQTLSRLWPMTAAADLLALTVAYFGTLELRFRSEWGKGLFARLNQFLGVGLAGELPGTLEDFYVTSAPRILLFMALTVCFLYALRGLYAGRRFLFRRPVAWDAIVANAAALALFYAYFYLSRNVFHPRSFFAVVATLNVALCVIFRSFLDRFLRVIRARTGADSVPAILLGAGAEADLLRTLLEERHPHGIRVVEQIRPEPGEAFASLSGRVEEAARRHGAGMILAADRDMTMAQIMGFLDLSDRLEVCAKVLSDKLDVIANRARAPADLVLGVPLVHFEAPATGQAFEKIKRPVSVAAALIVMPVALPVMALLALVIRATSRGPALFVQERIGANRESFRMFKFRTMRHQADQERAEIEELNESGGGLFKIRKDPRVTAAGKFLRRFSLDEIPQILNVIRGEMALVGPRPLPRRDFENYYEEWHYSRHGGMPGLTCLWQVSGRSDLGFQEMCILDVYYLRNQTWVLDVKILLRTVWVVLFAKGAY